MRVDDIFVHAVVKFATKYLLITHSVPNKLDDLVDY